MSISRRRGDKVIFEDKADHLDQGLCYENGLCSVVPVSWEKSGSGNLAHDIEEAPQIKNIRGKATAKGENRSLLHQISRSTTDEDNSNKENSEKRLSLLPNAKRNRSSKGKTRSYVSVEQWKRPRREDERSKNQEDHDKKVAKGKMRKSSTPSRRHRKPKHSTENCRAEIEVTSWKSPKKLKSHVPMREGEPQETKEHFFHNSGYESEDEKEHIMAEDVDEEDEELDSEFEEEPRRCNRRSKRVAKSLLKGTRRQSWSEVEEQEEDSDSINVNSDSEDELSTGNRRSARLAKSSKSEDTRKQASSDEADKDQDVTAMSEEEQLVSTRRSKRVTKSRKNTREEASDEDEESDESPPVSKFKTEGAANADVSDSDSDLNSDVEQKAKPSREFGRRKHGNEKSAAHNRSRLSMESLAISEYTADGDDSSFEISENELDDDHDLDNDMDRENRDKLTKDKKEAPVFESFRISKIIASRTEKVRDWVKICAKMNTCEVDCGSRWTQEDQNPDVDEQEKFLVKWDDASHLHCSWETRDDLIELIDGAKTALSRFEKSNDEGFIYDTVERGDGDYFSPAWVQVDRIMDVYYPPECPLGSVDNEDSVTLEELGIVLDTGDPSYKKGLGRQIMIKWKDRGYESSVYEWERDLILNGIEYKDELQRFQKRIVKATPEAAKKDHEIGQNAIRHLYDEVFGEMSDSKLEGGIKAYQQRLEEFPFRGDLKLRDYQVEGVSWMMSNYVNNRSSILADEMGLGKTIQVSAFFKLLANDLRLRGPFLVSAPLSTLGNWKRELDAWLGLNTVVYHGSAKDRSFARQYEMAYAEDRPDPNKSIRKNEIFLRKCSRSHDGHVGNPWMVEVVLTTPELLTAEDTAELMTIKWECLVVDEAHRLKNHNSKLALNLRDPRFRFAHKVLLTGTPIQNSMEELFALLNFIDPHNFGNLNDFLAKYGKIENKESLDQLHSEIQPYLLRRLKEDVEKSVPPKEETLIEVELTTVQKQYYRALYEKNVRFLHKHKSKASDGPSLLNLAMQLRKCCNHIFLLKGIEAEYRKQQLQKGITMSEGDLLVATSGKLVLLDKLLPRLKEDGHRILLFSQFKIMLDVLEDYLHNRNFLFERIDGQITGIQRQKAIDRYQDDSCEEPPFIMLLSTRAGGVGINLTAADTCIIFDSDFNPQNDIQAQARCHRIGQTRNVKVYRLLASKSYEMKLFDLASKKLGLDQAVLSGFEANSSGIKVSNKEVERLLKEGAYSLLKEEDGGAKASNEFINADIDTILERCARTVVHEGTGSKSAAKGGKFSKARFASAMSKDGRKEAHDIDMDDPKFWEKVLGEAALQHTDENIVEGKRQRTIKNYSEYAQEHSFLESDDDSETERVPGVQQDTTRDDDDDDSFDAAEESDSDSEDEKMMQKLQAGNLNYLVKKSASVVPPKTPAGPATSSAPIVPPNPNPQVVGENSKRGPPEPAVAFASHFASLNNASSSDCDSENEGEESNKNQSVKMGSATIEA